VAGQFGGSPTRIPATKAKYGVNTNGERHRRHHNESSSYDRHFADKGIIRPTNDTEHEAATKSEACGKKEPNSEDALSQSDRVDAAVKSEAKCDRDKYPADGVINDHTKDKSDPDIPTHEMKFMSRTTIAKIFTEAIESVLPRNGDVIRRRFGPRQHFIGQ
jgi:hypothetical protein